MIIIESILLWFVAACALLLIMQYVMRTPQTPERPQLGLGKRYPIGAKLVRSSRHIEEEEIDMEPPPAPVRRRTAENRRPVRRTVEQPVYQQAAYEPLQVASQQVAAQSVAPQPVSRQVLQQKPTQVPIQQDQPQAEEPIVIEVQNARKNKKRTDTMQMMLNRAIAERR